MLRNAVEDAPTPGEDETATIVAATPPAIASDPAWHAHRNARDCRVYGRRLAVGELIEEGDLFEAPTLRSWSPTHFAGQHVTAGTARAYVRPAPPPPARRRISTADPGGWSSAIRSKVAMYCSRAICSPGLRTGFVPVERDGPHSAASTYDLL